MNICAVRNIDLGSDQVEYLPHEAESADRFSLNLINAPGTKSEFAECKHCSCIFAVEVRNRE